MRVGLGTDVAVFGFEGLGGPGAEAPVFVVEEDAAVFYGGRALLKPIAAQGYRVTMGDGDIGPPIPRRNADAGGEIVDAKDGAATVAAGDAEGTVHAGERVVHKLQDITFPLAGDTLGGEFAGGGESVEQRALTEGADDDEIGGGGGGGVFDGGRFAGDAGDVLGEVVGGAEDGGRGVGFNEERDGGLAMGEQPDIRGRRVVEIHGQTGGQAGER